MLLGIFPCIYQSPGESSGQRSLAGYIWGRKSRTQLSDFTSTTTSEGTLVACWVGGGSEGHTGNSSEFSVSQVTS